METGHVAEQWECESCAASVTSANMTFAIGPSCPEHGPMRRVFTRRLRAVDSNGQSEINGEDETTERNW